MKRCLVPGCITILAKDNEDSGICSMHHRILWVNDVELRGGKLYKVTKEGRKLCEITDPTVLKDRELCLV